MPEFLRCQSTRSIGMLEPPDCRICYEVTGTGSVIVFANGTHGDNHLCGNQLRNLVGAIPVFFGKQMPSRQCRDGKIDDKSTNIFA